MFATSNELMELTLIIQCGQNSNALVAISLATTYSTSSETSIQGPSI